MKKKTFRVYFIAHQDGARTGILMRNWSMFFDTPPPSAYGADEADCFRQIELALKKAELERKDDAQRYLWNEEFSTRKIAIDIHPQTVVQKRTVIGKKNIPLRLTYAYSEVEHGGFRVMLPRFDWWFIVEDLDIGPEVLRSALSSALVGEKPKWIYDFRAETDEYVREWSPEMLAGLENRSPIAITSEYPTLEAVAEELVDKATKHKLPPVVGTEADSVVFSKIFDRTPPPSILLVGGPGVGKTTWVRRLARYFASEKREKRREKVPRIWSTSRDRIVAGMVYLGMWQERCLKILEELSAEGDYLYVDRLTSLLQTQTDGASIAEVLAPGVYSEEISLIAECTQSELERARKRAPAFVNAFQLVRLHEPPAGEVPPLLLQYQARKNSKATIHPEGMRRLVRHLDAFQRDRCFPGKAFRFVDWLAAEHTSSAATLYPKDVSLAYSRFSGLPLELISDEHSATQEEIAAKLRAKVIGQDEACARAAAILARFKAGMNDPNKPCGSLFFVGPTGVGKTELAKQLARYMFGNEERMVRLDMSEYMTPGSAQRLLDVGDGAKSLAERVRQEPLSLVLLDEIEKAHPEVFDLLLGVLGEGRLTDSLGRLVDFRMVVIVMTSNLGAGDAAAVGFGGETRADFAMVARRHFRPELWGRIDEVLSFKTLSPANIETIVDLTIASLSERTGLLRRALSIRVEPSARALLAELGYHPARGARPLKRLVEEAVITPVAVRMAKDPTFRERVIVVRCEDRAIVVDV